MSRFIDEDDVIIIDDFDDFDSMRNATVIRRGGSRRGGRRRTGGGLARRVGQRATGVLADRGPVFRGEPVEAVQVAQPAPAPARPMGGLSFGNLSTGEVIDSAAQALAALTPLPQPPTAQANAVANVENMIRYQQALAQHAKRDEQLRTIGSIAKNLWS